MLPNCYLNHMNPKYRSAPPMPSPSMFPGTPQGGFFIEEEPNQEGPSDGMNQGMNQNMPQMVPGNTSSGAPTPGAKPGPTPTGVQPSPFVMAPGSPVVQDTQYTQGYLRTQIGKRVRVTFLLGTNTIQDRVGVLKDVGVSYIILTEPNTSTDVLADIFSIKFVDIFPPTATTPLGF